MKRIYKKRKDEISAIYIRFKYSNLNHCNYIGQTNNILKGRPFRTHAYGGSYRGRVKWQSLILLKCPSSRLDTREAYFILKYRPKEMKLGSYFKKAWHLLKKSEMLFILTKHILIKCQWSPADWKHMAQQINQIGKSSDRIKHYNILKNLDLTTERLELCPEKISEAKTDKGRIERGELLDCTSTLPQQRIWLESFKKKFGLPKSTTLPVGGIV